MGGLEPLELILVRHATTDWTGVRFCGLADPPLNDVGRAQAAALAKELATTLPNGTRIVSSPLRRALETATAIGHATGGEVTVDDRWREVDMGDVEGLTWEEVEARWPDLAAQLATGPVDVAWPGGDPAGALTERVRDALSDLVGRNETTVVVSHGGPIRLAARLAGEPSIGDPGTVAPGQVVRLRLASAAPAGT